MPNKRGLVKQTLIRVMEYYIAIKKDNNGI